jgi:hypothetical protein
MADTKQHLGRVIRTFLLSAVVCVVSGAALATCTIGEGAGAVPCYIVVQPIDVCNSLGICAPFNTTSTTGTPSTAGMLFQTPSPALPSPIPASIPNNSTSANPIGFVVDPATGFFPGGPSGYTTPGVDVTRALLNNAGVELVWLPMHSITSSFTTVNVTQTTNTVATCTGSISGFTLTITKCSGTPGAVAVSDALSGSGVAAGTVVTGVLTTGSNGAGTFTVSISQTVKSTTITATTISLGSQDFLTLSQQDTKSTTTCAIAKQPCTPLSPRGGPTQDPTVVNLFFVNKLNPPPSGGTLYGFSWICNNGVAIGQNTFFAPTPLQARPDTIAHELLHDLCLDHTTNGAGPWTPPTFANPPHYAGPAGVAPPIPTNPLSQECDSAYPACGANVMTAGSLRTPPSLQCVLAPLLSASVTPPASCLTTVGGQTVQSPGLYTGMADQVTPLNQSFGYGLATPQQLPVSQEQQVLNAGSGLLFSNNPALMFSGLLKPIPHETTKAQLGTGNSTDVAIFDLSGPIGGKRGETLVAWVLTLPPEQTFARHDGVRTLSQSRADLVQDVNYYPASGQHPPVRNIAYRSGDDKTPDNPSIGTAEPSPCTATECLMVKFQPPGLGEHDTISFSESILSGDMPITNDALCNAKITYIFSDGFATTSNFGRCPAASLPLVASSWRPDPHVAPYIVKSHVLLVDTIPPTCPGTPDPNTGLCRDPTQSPPADVDPSQEGGQLGNTCNNSPINGIIPGGHVTPAGPNCSYKNCEFSGNLTINGQVVAIDNCQLDGNLTLTAGTLSISNSHVLGNVQISLASTFNVGLSTNIDGNLTIQSLGPNDPGTVCATQIGGNVTVQNNSSQLQIGEPAGQTNCPGNTINGNLNCTGNNPIPTSGSNTVKGSSKTCTK